MYNIDSVAPGYLRNYGQLNKERIIQFSIWSLPTFLGCIDHCLGKDI